MLTKKEVIMGSEIKLALSPIQALRSTMDVRQPEKPIIRYGTKEYRVHVKKVAERGIEWGGLTTGAQKEVLGVRKARRQRGDRRW